MCKGSLLGTVPLCPERLVCGHTTMEVLQVPSGCCLVWFSSSFVWGCSLRKTMKPSSPETRMCSFGLPTAPNSMLDPAQVLLLPAAFAGSSAPRQTAPGVCPKPKGSINKLRNFELCQAGLRVRTTRPSRIVLCGQSGSHRHQGEGVDKQSSQSISEMGN